MMTTEREAPGGDAVRALVPERFRAAEARPPYLLLERGVMFGSPRKPPGEPPHPPRRPGDPPPKPPGPPKTPPDPKRRTPGDPPRKPPKPPGPPRHQPGTRPKR